MVSEEMAASYKPGRRRVAVIGAGVSGLATAKCLLDEGLEPVVFEQKQERYCIAADTRGRETLQAKMSLLLG